MPTCRILLCENSAPLPLITLSLPAAGRPRRVRYLYIFAAASLHRPTFDFQLSTVDFPPTMLKSCLATYEHSL
jgi:hypothetical protein